MGLFISKEEQEELEKEKTIIVEDLHYADDNVETLKKQVTFKEERSLTPFPKKSQSSNKIFSRIDDHHLDLETKERNQ